MLRITADARETIPRFSVEEAVRAALHRNPSIFALSSRYNIAWLDAISRTLEKEQTILDLTRSVRSACYYLVLAGKILEVRNDEVQALNAHKRDAEQFFSQGLIPPNR